MASRLILKSKTRVQSHTTYSFFCPTKTKQSRRTMGWVCPNELALTNLNLKQKNYSWAQLLMKPRLLDQFESISEVQANLSNVKNHHVSSSRSFTAWGEIVWESCAWLRPWANQLQTWVVGDVWDGFAKLRTNSPTTPRWCRARVQASVVH